MAASPAIFIEDFGQKVDLTRRIREVLLNYPEGTTVLKEVIQNADDAGATTVRLCLDRRAHGSGSLLSDSLAQWQGPALLAYNDAIFSEEDFASISRIGGSSKHSQATKTGRFGVGFNSVYHLTDLPSFVSGKYVVLFDPQGVYLPQVSAANPGKRIDFVNSSAISIYKDQFSPYCAFGCDMQSSFSGTLFRFPLRNADQAVNSKLSRQAYEEDDIRSMFTQLYEEGVLTLLFLKSVLSIEMYIWDVGQPEPMKLYSCSVCSANSETILHRQAFLTMSKSADSKDSEMDSFSLDFLSETSSGNNFEKKVDTFYIVQAMASRSSRISSFASTASREHDMHLLPWASVAACISPSDTSVLKLGGASCFLPLPVRTGLSVQVNAYFEVSSNRRGIWYGDDMDRSGKVRSVWNRLLLEDLVAPIFARLLLGVQQVLGPTDLYYSLWPVGRFEEPWNILVEYIFRNIANAPVLYSEIQGGNWVSPSEAFLHDAEFDGSKELGEALIQLGMPIVSLSHQLFSMILSYASIFQQKVVTPHNVRQHLKGCRILRSLSKSAKLVLLEYCLEDLIDADVGTHAYDIPLLPLANGDFCSLSDASKGSCYFVCNELEFVLLQKVLDRVIDRNIPLHLLGRLTSIAKSSRANLTLFSIDHLIQLFPSFVPGDWKYKNTVFWDPENCRDHPTPSWFLLFWQYVKAECEKLSLFSEWPILPSTSGHLCRASRRSRLIRGNDLSDKMKDILAKIGCKILSPDFGVEHHDLSHFIWESNITGVLESIFDSISLNGGITQTFQSVGAEERDVLRIFLLDFKWYIGGRVNDLDLQKCRKLPIYKVYSPGSDLNIEYADLEVPQKYLPPLDIPESFLGVEFVMISSTTEEEIFSKYYGIERMGKARFYREQVFCRLRDLQPETRDGLMLSVLKNLPQLCLEDPFLRECLRSLEFVPTKSGLIKCPSVLYDPRVEEIYTLLENSDCFPHGSFQESEILDMLQGLGLRTSISPETIIESAQQVERLVHEDPQKAYYRGKVLLSFLEVNAMKWLPDKLEDEQGKVNKMVSLAAVAFRPRNLKSDLEKFWNDLRMICWCPVLVSAPFKSLPWPVVSSNVAPPKLVRLERDLWLVSASMRILDGECSSTALSHGLGWSSMPGGSVIAAQLLELGKNNETVDDLVLRQELALAMPRIYSLLKGLLGTDEMDIVKAVLEGSRWIWVGDGFSTSDEVVLDGPLHLAPYIRVIPVDLAVFRELFLELGVREFLKPVDYVDILHRMAMRKGSLPLDPREIRAAILIVQHLSEVQVQDQVKIYLPDVSGRLFPSSELVYNDAPWLLSPDYSDSSFGSGSNCVLNAKTRVQKLVHGNISNDVAEKLGVCSLRRILLAENADSMNLSLYGAAEAFGQHEALTTRLKHILEMYADGPGVLFELVQNAEDAGASEVTFLLDKTQYGTSSVLSPEMGELQGPALCCFNDSVFSPQDLYAISRIGQESKLEKPFAIGRFGLGFNCVYHFTDIPAFVSGENLVMFDPHACNLPGITPSHPGLRIRFAGRNILEQFPDQFSPFLHFGCDLQHPFPGTFFRFPLRNATVASRSQIKKETYTPEDVMSLFVSFSEVVSDALLFLRNVKTISIFVKEGTGHEMQLFHRVQKHVIQEPQAEHQASHQIFSFIDGNKHSGMDKGQFVRKLVESIGKDHPCRCQKVIVREQGSCGALSHFWITSECLSGGRSKDNLATSTGKSANFVPWACVAAHLHSETVEDKSDSDSWKEDASLIIPELFQVAVASTKDKQEFEGRAFCFLPLPISTGLPAHVNAYFELSSNRRDIWFGNDMAGHGKKRSDWNLYLLKDVAAPAYGHLLEKLAVEIGPCDLFFSFWPTAVRLEPWVSMVRELYASIANFGFRVLHTKARGGQWIAAKQALFPDFKFHKAYELAEALSDAGLPLVMISEPIVEKFAETCPSLHFLTPHFLRSLLIRRRRNFSNRDGVILTLEYCLLDLNGTVKTENLYGLPLLPLADGSFTTFDKNGIGERIYIAQGEEYGLLKDFLPHQLIDSGIPEEVHVKLCDIAKRGDSNLSFLSSHLLEKLFVKFLPAEWQNATQVNWSPGHEGHPSFEWMNLFWSYLKLSCHDLSLFSKWPILPVGSNFLCRLTENSNVLINHGWSENMSCLLVKVGCQFLRPDMIIEHPQLDKFVQPPTAIGILKAFSSITGKPENIYSLFSDVSEGELHELKSFILQSKWFFEEQVDDHHISIIRSLPIFESYRSRKLVSLNRPIKLLKPNGVRDDLLNDDFIRTETEREKIILKRYLEVQEPEKLEFYKDYALKHMSEFVNEPDAISAILHDIKLLIDEDNSIKSILCVIPFVLAADGCWLEPSRLYDPRVSELQKILHIEAFFPSEKFSDPDILDILIDLGLRRTFNYTTLLDCARSVSLLYNSGNLEALNYGTKLLGMLDNIACKISGDGGGRPSNELSNLSTLPGDSAFYGSNNNFDSNGDEDKADPVPFFDTVVDDISEEEFWSELKGIAWCPICLDPPFEGFPWLKSTSQVAAPSIVRPKSQMWIVSSTMHILGGDCCSMYLIGKLGWMDPPPVTILLTQLIEISKLYGQLKLHSSVEPVFRDALQEGVLSLYRELQKYIGTDDVEVLKSALDGISWVWTGDSFVPASALAFDSPVKFYPYLYVVPSELVEFRDLLLALGVKPSFDFHDYVRVLQNLGNDLKGSTLSLDQLNFVVRILEAVGDYCLDIPLSESSRTSILVPDSSGALRWAVDLVYNDAPWIDTSNLLEKRFVHDCISNDLASKLGIQSLRCLSLVDEETTRDLPCVDYGKVKELLAFFGGDEFLLFDLLELADCCKAKKLHLIIDKRKHACQSLMQHNLAEFQGPGLVAILEGVTLSTEEISSLQLRPPWRLCGDTLNYGLGLLSCYALCDILYVISSGYFYIFDPRGLALGAPSSFAPAAKAFSLRGTNLTARFRDQFSALLIDEDELWSPSGSTLVRMPFSQECMKDGLEMGLKNIESKTDKFLEHASRVLLFLKSVLQVTISTWEEGYAKPSEQYSVSVDSSFAVTRNPFSEKKWRKFQISRLFSSSNTSTKVQSIDVIVHKGATRVVDRWLVVLSLGSGQTRNMALDRKYMAYNLTPVAGVAAHVSRDGHPVICPGSSILSPLPLSSDIHLPVTVLGCFLVCHNKGRYLFRYQDKKELVDIVLDAGDQLIETWNRELMSCVLDSYAEMVMELQKLRREPSNSVIEPGLAHVLSLSVKAYGDQIYSFWPKSALTDQHTSESGLVAINGPRADWECIVQQLIRPFYARAVDLPVWQLYSGNLVKASEGMFLSQPGSAVGGNLLPATVCDFVKEQYPVFSVSWELVAEIQSVGVTVQEIKPKMVRDLLRARSSSPVLRSVDTYVDVMEYCLSDIHFTEPTNSNEDSTSVGGSNNHSISNESTSAGAGAASLSVSNFRSPNQSTHGANSSGDALEMVTSLGKALFDFSRGVVEDIGRAGVPLIPRNSNSAISNGGNGIVDHKLLFVAAELKGLPCPTAAEHLTRLGITELWLGSREQQELMVPLAAKFIHAKVMDRSILIEIFSNSTLQYLLKLQNFSLPLLSRHMKLLFHENWVAHVMATNLAPWFSWENTPGSGTEGGPSPEWIKLFWKNFNGSLSDLSLFSDWPLIPAFLGRSILCRVKESHLIFIPPPLTDPSSLEIVDSEDNRTEFVLNSPSESISTLPYITAFKAVKFKYPWLLSLLNQCSIPTFDTAFIECAASCNCLPPLGHSLGKVITSKLVAARKASYVPELTSFSASDRDELFSLFANDFLSNRSIYDSEELEAIRLLPIYKTVAGAYSGLCNENHCIISSNSFLKPSHEHCLAYDTESTEGQLLRALGIPELHDQQILVRFALPGYDKKPQAEQEDILFYINTKWHDIQVESSVIESLKETKFIRSADEFSPDLFVAKDLFDPSDSLLASVFSGERRKFPGERFSTDGWLHILRKIGLRTATEVDIILECANRVEYLATEWMKGIGDSDDIGTDLVNSQNGVPMEIYALAGSVVDSIFANFAVLYGNNFCNNLGKIACIPAELGFPSVAGRKGGKRVLTSYSDAILLKDWPLAWSCSPILTRQSFIPPEYSWGSFYLKSPPDFSRVLKHLQVIGRNGGEDTLAHWPIASGMMTVNDATLVILKYLDKLWDSLSSSDITELQKVAFLPAANGTRLVTADSLFVRLTINLSPFAFELPSIYLPYIKLLKDLGLQDMLSVKSAKSLLSDLQKTCGYQRLNPNELRAVMEILYFFSDGIVDVNVTDGLALKSEAVVPDDGCRLVHAQSCVYIDSHGSQFVKYIDTSRLRFVHPLITDKICEALGIRKLSDVVIEELCQREQLQTLDCIRSVPLAAIKNRLRSLSLHSAICTIVKSMSRYVPALSHLNLELIQKTLDTVAGKLQFVKSLNTQFILLPGHIEITRVDKESYFPGWEGGSPHRTLYFVDQAKACIMIAEPPACISVLDVIAIVVSQLLGSPIPLPIASLFFSPEGSESIVVDVMKICSDKRELEQRHWSNSLLGKEIQPQDAMQVQFHPLRPFYRGEIVAWRLQNGEKLRYGRVPEDVSPSAGQALYRLKVETMAGVTELLLSSQVFSFKNISMGIAVSSSSLQDDAPAVIGRRTHIAMSENSGTERARSSQSCQELRYGRVSAGELVQAVQELLSAAGIHMDVEKQSLLQNTISLQDQLKESQAALLLEQEKADVASKEADMAKAAWVCRVCLSAEVDVAIVPCGHVLCRRCSSAVSRCPFCRLQVMKTMKIFRP
ncbi:hypothetical protein ACJRO7_003791 [Eucalyptus globulus]|uniref:RING-type domain-containing protein n=1 Tax=Eucalyptus globulus TaxID=34317 RepID=A0ABD3IX25_EUCGL